MAPCGCLVLSLDHLGIPRFTRPIWTIAMRAIMTYCLLWAAGVSALLALILRWHLASEVLVVNSTISGAAALVLLLILQSAHERS